MKNSNKKKVALLIIALSMISVSLFAWCMTQTDSVNPADVDHNASSGKYMVIIVSNYCSPGIAPGLSSLVIE